MCTKVEYISFPTAIDNYSDENARNISQSWMLSPSVNPTISFYSEKIIIMESKEDASNNSNLLFIGHNTLAKSIIENLTPGPAATQFPLEYRQALRRGYFMAASDRRPVAEIIQTDVFRSASLPDHLIYMRILLPITLTGGLPALIVYSQFLSPRHSAACFGQSDPRLLSHKRQKPDLSSPLAWEHSSTAPLDI